MVLIVLGAILIVVGYGMRLYGDYSFFNWMHWVEAIMTTGVIGPGRIWKKIGNVLILVGIALILIGLKGNSRKSIDPDDLDDEADPYDDID